MSGEAVEEDKNEEVAEIDNTEVIEDTSPEARVLRDASAEASRGIRDTTEEQPTEQSKQEETITTPIEETKEETQPTAKAKPKATPKKLARTVKVVELVECQACNKKMLPKSLKNTHPHYCKGQPTETLPVNKQKASYGSKIEQKLRKEIEEEMKAKYETKNEVVAKPREALTSVQYSEPIEVKTKAKPSVPSVPRQLTARELLEASYNEIRKAKREAHIEKINSFKSKMF